MNILLINPTLEGCPESLHLGLAAVGTWLETHTDHRAAILDLSFHRGDWQETLFDHMDRIDADVVGFYVSTPFFPNARTVADYIKKHRPHVVTVAGGHHPTLEPQPVIDHPTFDMLVVGEGEIPIRMLMDRLEAGEMPDGIPGLWWKDEQGNVHKTEKGEPVPHDQIPMLNWDLYPEETLQLVFELWGMLPVMGSRGCPYRCSFCAITGVQKLYKGQSFLRFRDPIEVVDEIETNYKKYGHLGLRLVWFYDLNFLIKPAWLKEFTAEYRKRGLNTALPWSAYTRADHIGRLALDHLKDSGCVQLRVGIEAANETMRNAVYNKEVSQEQLVSAITELKRMKIAVNGYFLTGGPGDRPEYLRESLEFAYDHGIEVATFLIYQPLAGTDIFERAEHVGVDWTVKEGMDETARDFFHTPFVMNDHINEKQLVAFHKVTQFMVGGRLLRKQIARGGIKWFTGLGKYLYTSKRFGFGTYDAMTYYTYYGRDHLTNPVKYAPKYGERSPTAKLAFKALGTFFKSDKDDPAPWPKVHQAPGTSNVPLPQAPL